MISDQTITKTITIRAPVAKVWETITNPEIIREWLTENGTTAVTTDWKIGSLILFTGIWHKVKYQDKGTILQFEAEKSWHIVIGANFPGYRTVPKIIP